MTRSRGFFFRSNPENKGSGITSQEHPGGGFPRSPGGRFPEVLAGSLALEKVPGEGDRELSTCLSTSILVTG